MMFQMYLKMQVPNGQLQCQTLCFWPEGDQKYGDDFYIISGRKIQNLETQYQSTERGYAKRLKRSKVQYNLLDSGSAFYGTCMLNLDNKNHKKLGYNYLISTKQ